MNHPSTQRKRTPKPLNQVVDLHFHGAFGVDLVWASPDEILKLQKRLYSEGQMEGYFPTLLSLSRSELRAAVGRISEAMRLQTGKREMSQAFGIHLEGPYLSRAARGAHSDSSLRLLDLKELEELWEVSGERIRMLTCAPEEIPTALRKKFYAWAHSRKIYLSMGHTQATLAQANLAIQEGFRGVTHAWNAMRFHHRDPGVLGAAVGRPGVYLEMIPDLEHVALEVTAWMLSLHRDVYFVSDCAPMAGEPEGATGTFGNLKISREGPVCRLNDPSRGLAGGGRLLLDSYQQWIPALYRWLTERGERVREDQLYERFWEKVSAVPRSLAIPGGS